MTLKLLAEARRAGARLKPACDILGLSVRTVQRWLQQRGGEDRRHGPKTEPPNKLSERERQRILEVVNSPEFCELTPHQIVPHLTDRGIYLASVSTIYRILREEAMLTHRQRARPAVSRRPREYVATRPCQLWSWDITYLRGPIRGTFFFLYLILDVWSRKIVGAEVYSEETPERAAELFQTTCRRHELDPMGIVLHSDNGNPMKGSTMLVTLQMLGVVASFSRPRNHDDNPYSEALFRTLKYVPAYPERPFASLEQARAWVERFVHWYNTEHLHSALRFVTPDDRHYGREHEILARRRRVYEKAKQRHPERWAGRVRNWQPVGAVVLNPENAGLEMKAAA